MQSCNSFAPRSGTLYSVWTTFVSAACRTTARCAAGLALIVASQTAVIAADNEESQDVYQFELKSLEGEPVDLEKYKGKVLLIVNVASKCGLTPQYTKLQQLHEKYGSKGLAILGFPCNQFGGQEPGSAKDISEFCTTKYGVTFDMFEKIAVNGDDANPLYKYLTGKDLPPVGSGKISWNFEKFLVGSDGEVLARFSPRTAPDDEELIAAIEKALSETK